MSGSVKKGLGSKGRGLGALFDAEITQLEPGETVVTILPSASYSATEVTNG